jgi:hypothetical protein
VTELLTVVTEDLKLDGLVMLHHVSSHHPRMPENRGIA